jgi:hypothetical protein
MFCPSCKDEFRPGFTRCASCGVDLVEDLSAAEPKETEKAQERTAAAPPSRLADYCGFLGLEEARQARDSLRAEGIRADIVVREAPTSDLEAPVEEEYWLRVEVSGYARAPKILGFHPGETGEEEPAGGGGDTAGLTGRFAPKIIAPAGPGDAADEPRSEDDDLRCSDCGRKVAAEEPFCPNCGARFEDD